MPNNENKQRYLRANGQLVAVSEEVYTAYFKMRRRERYLEERDTDHGLVHYASLDNSASNGEEELRDWDAVNVEDVALNRVMAEKLLSVLDLLTERERALIEDMFFSNGGRGMTEREYAACRGLSKTAVHARKEKVFARLRELLENNFQNS